MDLSSPPLTPIRTALQLDRHQFTTHEVANGPDQAAGSLAGWLDEAAANTTSVHPAASSPLLSSSPITGNGSVVADPDDLAFAFDSPSSSELALGLQRADALEKAYDDQKKLEAAMQAMKPVG